MLARLDKRLIIIIYRVHCQSMAGSTPQEAGKNAELRCRLTAHSATDDLLRNPYCVAGWDRRAGRMLIRAGAASGQYGVREPSKSGTGDSRDRGRLSIGNIVRVSEPTAAGSSFPHATEDRIVGELGRDAGVRGLIWHGHSCSGWVSATLDGVFDDALYPAVIRQAYVPVGQTRSPYRRIKQPNRPRSLKTLIREEDKVAPAIDRRQSV